MSIFAIRILLIAIALSPGLAGAQVSVPSEKTTNVTVSARDVNRLVCETPVDEVFWSQEKPVDVTSEGHNVFVKFKVLRGESEPYTSQAVDVHVVCAGEVYTLILQPRLVDSVTVHLGDRLDEQIRTTVSEWAAMPIEEKVKRFSLAVYRENFPSGFERHPLAPNDPRRNVRLYSDLQIIGQFEVVAPGTGLKATEYRLRPERPMAINERDFMAAEFGDIVSITVDPLEIVPGRGARLIVIERSVLNGLQ